MMEERYHATIQNQFYPNISNVNKNITVEAKLISPPTYNFLFSQKVLASKFPPGSPVERDTRLQGILHIPICIHISLSQKALRKERPSMSPKSEAPMETRRPFQSLA